MHNILHKVTGVTFCYDPPPLISFRKEYLHGDGHFTEHLDHSNIQKPKMVHLYYTYWDVVSPAVC